MASQSFWKSDGQRLQRKTQQNKKKKKQKKKKKIGELKSKREAQGKDKPAGLEGVDYCRLVYNSGGGNLKGHPLKTILVYLSDRVCIRKPKAFG